MAWRNTSVSAQTIKKLKSEDGIGLGIERLVKEIEQRFSGYGSSEPQPVFDGLTTRQCFYNSYPAFYDENNLSMAVFLKCHGIGVMFTGDLGRLGFTSLLQRPDFKQALRGTNVYVASHHGPESGCSDEVAALLTNVYYVVISDKGYAHDTQKTIPFYHAIAKGGPFRDQATRYVLTTRNDGRIAFEFTPTSWGPSF